MPAAPDWARDAPDRLRAWRMAQPDAASPVLPRDVTLVEDPASPGSGIECRPGSVGAGAVLHFHGGGFLTGSPWTHRCVGAALARAFARVVWLCPYPLAPEQALPTQAEAAAQSLRVAVDRYGPDLILSGDSAGAMIALWAYAHADPATRGAVSRAILFYGFFGLVPQDGSEADGLGPAALARMRQALDPQGLWTSAAFDPLHGTFPLPPRVLAIGAGNDPLLPNTTALAEAHDQVTKQVAPGLGHGFLSAVTPDPTALAMLDQIATQIR